VFQVAQSGRKNADDALVAALAAGASGAAAAAKAEVSERTVRRRLEDPLFRARVDEARAELVRQAVGRLADVGALASDTLADLVKDGPPAVRLGAARAILEHMFRGHEQETMARQLAELKKQVEVLTRGDGVDEGGPQPPEEVGGEPRGGGPEPTACGAEGRPQPPPDAGGDDPGPVATGPPPLFR
jgi:hypothetical protein